jgi:hypothetical protein
MTLQRNAPPHWAPPEVRSRWISASSSLPQKGELWTLSWNSEFEGMVVIAAVYKDHILGLPVTAGHASREEALIEASAFGTELAVWPEAETGLGMVLLDRNLGRAFDDDAVLDLRKWGRSLAKSETILVGSGDRDDVAFISLLNDFHVGVSSSGRQ